MYSSHHTTTVQATTQEPQSLQDEKDKDNQDDKNDTKDIREQIISNF